MRRFLGIGDSATKSEENAARIAASTHGAACRVSSPREKSVVARVDSAETAHATPTKYKRNSVGLYRNITIAMENWRGRIANVTARDPARPAPSAVTNRGFLRYART